MDGMTSGLIGLIFVPKQWNCAANYFNFLSKVELILYVHHIVCILMAIERSTLRLFIFFSLSFVLIYNFFTTQGGYCAA